MLATAKLKHLKHCFCQIPLADLEKWFNKRYQQGIPTLELLAQAGSAYEREVITIVAMFELDDETALQLMGDVNLPEHHILHCREYFRHTLQQCLAEADSSSSTTSS
jgi:hypothetical protein